MLPVNFQILIFHSSKKSTWIVRYLNFSDFGIAHIPSITQFILLKAFGIYDFYF
jgi:hypothetical protein